MSSRDKPHNTSSINEMNTNATKEQKAPVKSKKSLSMHDDVPVWYDCCSCEAEPYWLEAMHAKDDKKAGSL